VSPRRVGKPTEREGAAPSVSSFALAIDIRCCCSHSHHSRSSFILLVARSRSPPPPALGSFFLVSFTVVSLASILVALTMLASTPQEAPLGTAWLEASLEPRDATELSEHAIGEFCAQHTNAQVARSAAPGGGIVPHMTLWYIGAVTESMLDGLVAAAREANTAERVLALLDARPGTVRLEHPFPNHIALRYATQDDDKLRAALGNLFDTATTAGVFATHKAKITPYSQPLTPHLTLFEHSSRENAAAHFADLRANGSMEHVAASWQALHFGRAHLAVRDKRPGFEGLRYVEL